VGVLRIPRRSGALIARSALKLDTLETIIIAWPRIVSRPSSTRCSARPRGAAVILSWDPHGLPISERHARRAEIIGDIPLDPVGKPLGRSRRRARRGAGRSPCSGGA